MSAPTLGKMSHPVTSLVASSAEHSVAIAACTRGGHLTSWIAAGRERFWMSPESRCGQPDALRGGVPVLFPQFGAFGPLPKHGFARTSVWREAPANAPADGVALALRLHDSAETRAIWPTPFELTIEIAATATWLEMTLRARNLDDYDAHFTGGLHNYFPVSPGARITGLEGLLGWDAVTDPGQPTQTKPVPAELDPVVERDLIVNDVAVPVVLHDPELGDLRITATGFPNRVVWNPGPNQNLPDVPKGLEAGFVCIEPAVVSQVLLAGGATWEGTQRLEILPS